jgi:hypothetical protein
VKSTCIYAVYTHTHINSYAHTVSFHIYMYTCVHIHTYAQTQILMHVFLCAHSVPVCAHGASRAYIYICTYSQTHINDTCEQDTNTDMYGYIYMHVWIYANICTHSCGFGVHVCKCTHTHMYSAYTHL